MAVQSLSLFALTSSCFTPKIIIVIHMYNLSSYCNTVLGTIKTFSALGPSLSCQKMLLRTKFVELKMVHIPRTKFF